MKYDPSTMYDGNVIVTKKFAWTPKVVNVGKFRTKEVWLKFYYERREYMALIPGYIEGWDISLWDKNPNAEPHLKLVK